MATLDLQVRLRAIDQASRVFAQLRERNGALIRTFDRTREAFRGLNQQLQNIQALQRHRQALDNTGREMQQTRERLQQLQQAMANTSASDRQSRAYLQLARELQQTENRLGALRGAQMQELNTVSQLAQRLRDAGVNLNNLSEEEQRLRNEAGRTNDALEEQIRRLRALDERRRRLDRAGTRLRSGMELAGNTSMVGMGAMGGARMGAAGLSYPLVAFAAQEKAAADLKTVMMDSKGNVGAFEDINKIITKMAAELPGTVENFTDTAKALKLQGVSDELMKNGALEQAIKLGVVMNLDPDKAAEVAAKMVEAHGLKDTELAAASDYMQRLMTSFGVTADNIQASQSYYSAAVNAVNLTGMDNYKKIAAIQGIAASQGLEGSPFGTALDNFLKRLGPGLAMVMGAKSGTKADARKILRKAGVKFNFYDKQGNLKDLEAIAEQLNTGMAKVRKVGGSKAVLTTLESIFGDQGGRLAQMLADKGAAGLREALEKIESQGSIDMRIKVKTETVASQLEALQGVWAAAMGSIGSTLKDDLGQLVQRLSGFVENTLQPWINNNKELIRTIMMVAAVIVGLAAVLGSILLVIAPFIGALSLMRYAMVFIAASPVMMLITAIGLLAVAIYNIGGRWRSIWEGAKNLFVSFVSGILNLIGNLVGLIVGIFGGVLRVFYEVFVNGKSWVEAFGSSFEFAINRCEEIISGFMDKLRAVKNTFLELVGLSGEMQPQVSYESEQLSLALSAAGKLAKKSGMTGQQWLDANPNHPAAQVIRRGRQLPTPTGNGATIGGANSEKAVIKQNNQTNNQTINQNINIKVEGKADKETAALIEGKIKSALAANNREIKARSNSAMFDQGAFA